MDEFEVIGGRQLYQWDTDRSIEVRLCDGESVNEVHYAHAEDDIAPVVKVQDYDGRMFADIPNILLQRFGTLKVWAVVYTEDGRQTLRNAYLSVRARAKPDDYVYTETEIMDYRKVAEDLAAVAAITDRKLDKQQSVADAGKLLYIDSNGEIRPLTLGKGLEIVDGVLRVTAAAAEDVEFVADEDGGVMLAGVEFVAHDDGSVMLDGAVFTAQPDGSIRLEHRNALR